MKAITTPYAWLFDVDGVLVHIEEHTVVELQLIDEIIKHLSSHEPVALISGRSVAWQRDNVVTLIHQEFAKTSYSPTLLDNLYLSGEFGGTAIEFRDGEEIFEQDESLLIPENLLTQAHKIAEPYLDNFIIEPKQTIFTIYGKSLEQFNLQADILIRYFQDLVTSYHLEDELEVHKDTTAINIKHKKANKHYATQQVLSWLQEKHLSPKHYLAFGDSASDIQIGEELAKQGLAFTFVYVGSAEKLPEKPSFPFVQTKERFDKGTLEFLQSFDKK